MDPNIRLYLAQIGSRGGKKSRRTLSPQTARSMVLLREARRAFRKFGTSCFWSYDPKLSIAAADIAWIAQELRKNGDRKAWEAAERLCR